ncbi:hypothetical protein C7M84_003267 [Penaeus vannamei]|uniref:5-oxoprolinase n=1 Tax=Penaeus vannamei TaxID=6689 RepID=A0A423TNJ4_PENVA|nr:hypothetical protein C7M84_003267 [Penaeus vannamei]
MFVVGPDSAGAHPGPVCYKKGGPLAVTDANLVLGRLLPHYFPKIFGPQENEPLDKDSVIKAFKKITNEVNAHRSTQQLNIEEVAMGFIRVANEAMCRPIRALTQAKGHDTSQHALAVFGGAGGQHACAVARSLGMKTVMIHKYAGILSAFGMALADVVHEAQEPCAKNYDPDNFVYFESRLSALENECVEALMGQGFSRANIACEPFLHLRYQGTDCALMVTPLKEKMQGRQKSYCYVDFQSAFLERYKREFGFVIDDRDIVVDDIRVRGVGKSQISIEDTLPQATEEPLLETVTKVYFEEGYQDTNVYLLECLAPGHVIPGPAIIMDKLSTILIEPGCTGHITAQGDVRIEIGSLKKHIIGTELDAIQLSIFSHRFMSLAEQMGRILQRTSISTNIKERLDFSCALFGPDGGLVSNAPHIPVHLGAMQETVQYQLQVLGDSLKDGDVLLSNHPSAGGSHLPDLTVITPVFRKGVRKPVFYVASRGHHADIGGITPGSMPPHSTSIHQEGAVFLTFKLVDQGVFQEKKLIEALNAPGKIEGSSGTRNLRDNLSDLRAQVAANHKGIQLVNELIDYYTLDVVQAYMGHIQTSAKLGVQDLLREVGSRVRMKTGSSSLHAIDYMDDGSPIELNVDIDVERGTAVFDFRRQELWREYEGLPGARCSGTSSLKESPVQGARMPRLVLRVLVLFLMLFLLVPAVMMIVWLLVGLATSPVVYPLENIDVEADDLSLLAEEPAYALVEEFLESSEDSEVMRLQLASAMEEASKDIQQIVASVSDEADSAPLNIDVEEEVHLLKDIMSGTLEEHDPHRPEEASEGEAIHPSQMKPTMLQLLYVNILRCRSHGDIVLAEYIRMYRLLNAFLSNFGSFAAVQTQMLEDRIRNLEIRHQGVNREEYQSLSSMIRFEDAAGTVGDIDPVSGTILFTCLQRHLQYLSLALHAIIPLPRDEPLLHPFESAYRTVLASHHNWFVEKFYLVGLAMLPSKEQAVAHLRASQGEYVSMEDLMSSLRLVVRELDELTEATEVVLETSGVLGRIPTQVVT